MGQQPVGADANTPAKTDVNFPKITVVLQNEGRFVQTHSAAGESDKNANDAVKIVSSPASNTSLAKRVLVKNAIETLNSNVTSEKIASAPANEAEAANSTQTADSKSTSASLAMFVKKTPKVRASIFANYEKRYRNHGLVFNRKPNQNTRKSLD